MLRNINKEKNFSPVELRRIEKEMNETMISEKGRVSKYAKDLKRFMNESVLSKMWCSVMLPLVKDENLVFGNFTSRMVEGKRVVSMSEVVVPAKRIEVKGAYFFKVEGYRIEVIEIENKADGSRSLKLRSWWWNQERFVPVEG